MNICEKCGEGTPFALTDVISGGFGRESEKKNICVKCFHRLGLGVKIQEVQKARIDRIFGEGAWDLLVSEGLVRAVTN